MKVRAQRGVCIGVERHLQPGEVADVDDGIVQFLVSIKAVEVVKEEPAAAGSADVEAASAAAAPVVDENPSKSATSAKKAGRKET